MQNPGTYDLGSTSIGSALTNLVITEGQSSSGAVAYLDRLDGMSSCTLDVNFTYGGGGTDAVLVVETSLTQGQTWVEVARFRFTTASAEKVMNLTADLEIAAAYAPVALSNDTGKSGVFGNRWRAKLTTTGTYTGNSAIAARMIAR